MSKGLYTPPSRGWFLSERARRPVRRWIEALDASCVSGDYQAVQEASVQLGREAELGGASLLELVLFMERFASAVLQRMRQDPACTEADVGAAQRMLTRVRHRLLAER